MAELEKVRRVIDRAIPGAPHETLLVLDATSGQNGLAQVREFGKALPMTGSCSIRWDLDASRWVGVGGGDGGQGGGANEEQRNDAQTLVALMRRVTRQEPRMWGPSIVGFGSYHYKYASGHEGDSALAGFAVRGSELVVYIAAGFEGRDVLLAKLGKHRTGKVCVYIRRLANVDLKVLETLVARSVAENFRPAAEDSWSSPQRRERPRRGGPEATRIQRRRMIRFRSGVSARGCAIALRSHLPRGKWNGQRCGLWGGRSFGTIASDAGAATATLGPDDLSGEASRRARGRVAYSPLYVT